MSQFFECVDDRKMSFLLSCDHRVYVEDAVKLIHFKLCPMCHRILKTADVLVVVEYLRERGFFYETGQEAKVCEMNLADYKPKNTAELSPAKRLRRARLSVENLRSCLEGALSSNDDYLEESSEEVDDSLEYSAPSPYYIPSESGEDDDED
ncbi:hypothetical protein AVEN_100639-1 [Araneus ventricosus]|uniref:Uncharacterized protein n=1 Tax=Araneus ventricosus TaxID=182803 RepID=A0A4Y2UTD5_ARAVE|nr:hypothetical protein AVEN_100639-1 [Araneus ventricosus]